MNNIRIGFPISISGRYSIQGKESLEGIKLWQNTVNSDSGIYVDQFNRKLRCELIYYDDKSSEQSCREITVKLLKEDNVDLFLGPYSSGLAVTIAPIAKELGRVVWNYGGATDEITEMGYKNFINAITPSSHYYHGIIDLFAPKINKANRLLAIVFASDSGFSARVKDGAKKRGIERKFSVAELGYESGNEDFSEIIDELIRIQPDIILGVGRMHDDINFAKWVIKSRKLLTEYIAVLAASIDHFKDVFGADADGFYSTSQWEKDIEIEPDFGPAPEQFYNEFINSFKKEPGYPAAQAYNIGVIIEKCIAESGTVDEKELMHKASCLDINTFYGRFKTDKKTGIQIGHKMCVIKWENNFRKLC